MALPRTAWKAGGPSPNPGGKPKQLPSAGLAQFIRDRSKSGQEMAELYFAVMRGQGIGAKANLAQRMQAAEWLASRGYGRAPDVSLAGDLDGVTNPLADVSTDELRAHIRALVTVSNHENGAPHTPAHPLPPVAHDAKPMATQANPATGAGSPYAAKCAACGLKNAHNLDCPERPKAG